MASYVLSIWKPEDRAFWTETGKSIAQPLALIGIDPPSPTEIDPAAT